MQFEVVRSTKRRKTVQARMVGEVVQVSIPARMTKAEEDKWVAEMVGRFERRRATEPIDLAARGELLAVRYRLPQPASIRWVDNQEWRWASCTPADRSIRMSTRLAGFPGWVLDYVIVHELAHLAVAGHGPSFWALVDRYPKTERARGFLMAKGLDGDLDSPPTDEGGPDPSRASASRERTARRRPEPRSSPGGVPQTLW